MTNPMPTNAPVPTISEVTSNPHSPPAHSGVSGQTIMPPQMAQDTFSHQPMPQMGPSGPVQIPASQSLPIVDLGGGRR